MSNTVIQIKGSGVTGNVPASLQPGELAINYVDGKLFYGNSTNQTVLFDAITEPAGLNGELQFNSLGSFGSDSDLSFNVSTKILTTGGLTTGNTIVNGDLTANVSKVEIIGNKDGLSILKVRDGSDGDVFRVAQAVVGGMVIDAVDTTLANSVPLTITGNVIFFNTVDPVTNNRIRALTVNGDGSVSINSAVHSSNTSTGALIISGGLGVNDNLHAEVIYANSIFDSTYRILDVANSAYIKANAAFDASNTNAITDFTNITISAGTFGNSIVIPVVSAVANGRIASISNTQIRSGTTSQTGIVQLFDSYNGTSNTMAATANAVGSLYTYTVTELATLADQIGAVSGQFPSGDYGNLGTGTAGGLGGDLVTLISFDCRTTPSGTLNSADFGSLS